LRACIVIVLFCSLVGAQSTNSTQSPVVPPLVKFTGVLTDVNSKALTGTVGVTFSLYNEAQGGSALWMETQNVSPDKTGHYSVMLGSTTSAGLPADIFVAGEARWLGIQPQGQAEQTRILLLSVPYALKAGDAQTIGGLPPSAFVLAASGTAANEAAITNSAAAQSSAATLSGTGKKNYIPLWLSASKLGSSILFQTGGNVGVG